MLSLVLYYLVILLPIPMLAWIAHTGNSVWFVIVLFIYVLPYRAIIDGIRLVKKHVITTSEIPLLFIPGKRFNYFRQLYVEK